MRRIFDGLGVNAAIKDHDSRAVEKMVEKICEMGFESVRLEFDFFSQQDSPSKDLFVKMCHENGIKVLGLVCGGVPGNIVNCFRPEWKYPRMKEEINNYVEYAAVTGEKYRNEITTWEIGNETNTRRFWPGGVNPDEYRELLLLTVRKLKKINPKNKILFAGIMGNDQSKVIPGLVPRFAEKVLANSPEAEKCIDGLAFHPYFLDCYISVKGPDWYKIRAARETKIITEYAGALTNKRVTFTEFGICPKWVRLTQRDIGKLYAWYYRHCRERNIDLYIWTLFDNPHKDYEPGSPEKYFGLLDEKLDDKPVYNVMKSELLKSVKTGDRE